MRVDPITPIAEPPCCIANFGESLANHFKCFFPRRRRKLAILANQRLREAVFVVREIKSVAALDAEEIAIDAALVAIVAAHDFHAGVGAAHAESRLAAVAAVRAGRADMVHLPWPGLVAIRARGECADRADVDAHAAFFAFEVIFLVGRDDGTDAAVLHAKRPDVHAFAADAHAAITQNATRAIEVNHRRPLLLVAVVLDLDEFRFGRAVGESHVLQFALAAGIANWAIQRMVAEQQFDHAFARLMDFVAIGGDAMPSPTTVVQAVCSLGIFSTLTRHMRHAPCRDRFG